MAEGVHIREVDDGDLEVFFEQQRDEEATRRAAFPARDREHFMTHWSKARADSAVTLRTVLADGEVAGNVVCWRESGKDWIGYWFGRCYWGRGIATKALTLFLDRVKTRPLYADPVAGNIGSIRVLEKCGFQRVTTPDAQPSPADAGHVLLALEN